MNLYTWARKWGVSNDAVADLRLQMGIDPSQPMITDMVVPTSEAMVQSNARLKAAKSGDLLWRNNVGAMQDADGRVVRFGLANESKQVNAKVKSADLIGLTQRIIQPSDVGLIFGIFTAEETKAPGWVYKGTEREAAQKKFLELVISRGGIARFSNGT